MLFSAEPEYGGRAYLEKQDYILFKQKEQLAAQEQKLEELTMKIEDVELHKGRILAKSEEETVQFTVVLPVS